MYSTNSIAGGFPESYLGPAVLSYTSGGPEYYIDLNQNSSASHFVVQKRDSQYSPAIRLFDSYIIIFSI